MMSSEFETVAEIVKCIRQVAHNVATANEETKKRWRPAAFLANVADRIAAAYQREILADRRRAEEYLAARDEVAELRECLKEAITAKMIDGNCFGRGWKCDTCGRDCSTNKWRKALKGANDEGK